MSNIVGLALVTSEVNVMTLRIVHSSEIVKVSRTFLSLLPRLKGLSVEKDLPNIQRGTLALSARFMVSYQLVNEVYITVYFLPSTNPFLSQRIIKQTQDLLKQLTKGMDVTIQAIDKKFAEVYLLLDKILNGIDIGHMDINNVKLADFASTFHSVYVNKEPGVRPQPQLPAEVMIELFDLEETDASNGTPLDIGTVLNETKEHYAKSPNQGKPTLSSFDSSFDFDSRRKW